MGFFRRDDDDSRTGAASVATPIEPPHPALASLDALSAAPLADLATAVLVAGLSDQTAWNSEYEFEIEQRVFAFTGGDRNELTMLLEEALQALERSLLIRVSHIGNSSPHVGLTRRGRRALDSGAPQDWLDLPRDPAAA